MWAVILGFGTNTRNRWGGLTRSTCTRWRGTNQRIHNTIYAGWSGMGAQGVFLAITIAESTLAVVAFFAFRRGRWKKQKV